MLIILNLRFHMEFKKMTRSSFCSCTQRSDNRGFLAPWQVYVPRIHPTTLTNMTIPGECTIRSRVLHPGWVFTPHTQNPRQVIKPGWGALYRQISLTFPRLNRNGCLYNIIIFLYKCKAFYGVHLGPEPPGLCHTVNIVVSSSEFPVNFYNAFPK